MIKLLITLCIISASTYAFTIHIKNDNCGSIAYRNALNLLIYSDESHPANRNRCPFTVNYQKPFTAWDGYLTKGETATLMFSDTYMQSVCVAWHWIKGNSGEDILVCDVHRKAKAACSYIVGPVGQIVGVLSVNAKNAGQRFTYRKGFLGCYPHKV